MAVQRALPVIVPPPFAEIGKAGLALGVKGYYYQQITGDSGAGALLGDFKSDSFGVGPGFVWVPEFGGGQLTVLGKWIHDFTAENRFESDYFTITGAWKF